ncbi:ribonuclease Oy-like [Belonocnema kinseyi]|uniref:ribonuclease Oy-like n=1 Tax=Belonocnema kinseyi TaxID=2817044 RepID=UPI00143CDF89|nr:ribonuclease Oy-like [Belonocnema kinseyi]
MDLLDIWKYLLFLIGFLEEYPKDGAFNNNSEINSSKSFDVIIFTQSWPKTVCFDWQESSESHKCSLPAKSQWSIHGLWPTELHTVGPNYCNNKIKFDAKRLQNIREELKVKWIDVHDGEHPESFWKHEWIKHGTCSINLAHLNSEEKYFRTGLELFDKYAMNNVLEKVNILPGKEYPVEQFLDGVLDVLGVESVVVCRKNRKTQEQYIMEIRVCLDKDLNLVNCHGIHDFPTNCNRTKNVIYLDTPPKLF